MFKSCASALMGAVLFSVTLLPVPLCRAASSDFTGEEITFAIRKVGVKVGDAWLKVHGPVQDQGQDYFLITFTVDGFNFYDEEKIFMDPQTFFPRRVERDLNIGGHKERISEQYDPGGEVRIHKVAGGKTTDEVIQKKGPIDNIYCFIYRYRRAAGDMKDPMTIHLPTKDVTMERQGPRVVKAAGKRHEAVYLESSPRKYSVWFEPDGLRRPLRIDGAAGFGNTSMVMTSPSAEGEAQAAVPGGGDD